jgi:hypothetical protein
LLVCQKLSLQLVKIKTKKFLWAPRHSAERQLAEWPLSQPLAKCFFTVLLNLSDVIIMNGIMLYVILPNVIMLNVVAPGFFIFL